MLISRLQQLDSFLSSQGIDFRLTNVVRSWAQQATDFAQGRTAPGKIITNAEPGESWHQYGFAADGVPMLNGVPDWDISSPAWQKVFAAIPSCGLFSGRNFQSIPDSDHIQLAEIPEAPTLEDIQTFKDGGMQAVWQHYFPA